MNTIDEQQLQELAQVIATAIGQALQQTYEKRDDQWWILTFGNPERPLTDDEVAWHVVRNHAPFVPDGLPSGHPDWWNDPVGAEQ